MRADGGYEVIKKAIEKLGLRHREHIAAYGEGNERRLTGKHETANIETFLWVSILFSTDYDEEYISKLGYCMLPYWLLVSSC